MAESRKEREKTSPKLHSEGKGPHYPYGLEVSLEHEQLNKLGMDKLPKVGDKLHLHAHAHVTHVSEHSEEGGKKRRSVRLQLRKMHIQDGELAPERDLAKGAKRAMDKALEPGTGTDNDEDD